MKEERDRISAELEKHLQAETSWQSKHAALEAEHSAVQETLAACESEKNALNQDKDILQSEVHAIQTDITLLQDKLTQSALELVSQTRQLQAVQSELKSAKRRAEEAERIQTDLQSEGTDLMRSLEEMRPRIVELTGEKLELSEKVSGLEGEVRSRDTAIAKLEAELDQYRELKEEAERRLEETVERYEKERSTEKTAAEDINKSHAEVTDELDSALATIRMLEKERSVHHQEAGRQLQEIERLTQSSTLQAERIAALRQEVDERNDIQVSEALLRAIHCIQTKHLLAIQNEEQEYIMQAQSEIEGLRQAVEGRDEEIERLRVATSGDDTPRSLDDEMLSSLKQIHALELSASQSRIRSLESAIFEAEARAHELQKQVAMLEDQRLRTLSPPPVTVRPSSHSASSHTHMNPPIPIPRSRAIDQNLSPEARHKRKVSLSMLKARIEREGLALGPSVLPHNGVEVPLTKQSHQHPRPQFLDDSHVFWCASCRGDLVIL